MTAPSRRAKWNLVLPGGLLAGAIIAVFVLARGLAVGTLPDDTVATLGLVVAPIPGFLMGWLLVSFVAGITITWFYAALRPRYGRGPKSALLAGFVFWFITTLVSAVRPSTELISLSLFLGAIVSDLVILIVASLAGTWLYLYMADEIDKFTWRD